MPSLSMELLLTSLVLPLAFGKVVLSLYAYLLFVLILCRELYELQLRGRVLILISLLLEPSRSRIFYLQMTVRFWDKPPFSMQWVSGKF